MKITIVSSMSSPEFAKRVLEIANELETQGHQVQAPFETEGILSGEENNNRWKEENLEFERTRRLEFLNLIKDTDVMLVTNFEKNGIPWYIGWSVLMEMTIGFYHNKEIFLLNPLPDEKDIKYVQEIKLMKPKVINGDLAEII